MKRQNGLGAIAAIVVLVILAVLSAAIVSTSATQQLTSAEDIQSARAWQAARAGNEWGLYMALKSGWMGTACDAAPQSTTLDLRVDTGFYATVTCASKVYNEGQAETTPGVFTSQQVRLYTITAVACPVATCPASDVSVAGIGYIERTRVVVATN